MTKITCSKCHTSLSETPDNFIYRNSKRHGQWCKTCNKKYMQKYYKKYKEKMNKKTNENYQTNYKRDRKKQKEYYENNKEVILEQEKDKRDNRTPEQIEKDNGYFNEYYMKNIEKRKEYYEKNKEHITRKRIEYYKKNPGKNRFEDYKYVKWAFEVKKIHNFTCTKCNKKSGHLNSHHIFPWANFPNLRYNIKNGICLCTECHKLFHSIHGLCNYFDNWMSS